MIPASNSEHDRSLLLVAVQSSLSHKRFLININILISQSLACKVKKKRAAIEAAGIFKEHRKWYTLDIIQQKSNSRKHQCWK